MPFGVTLWMIAAIWNRTTVDSTEASLHPGLGIAGRQFRSVDLVPDINFPWLDKAGGPLWFPWWKDSSMSAPGLAFRERNSLVMSTVFDFADPSFVTLFFKYAGDLLLNVYSLALGITSDKGLVTFSIRSETNSLNIVWPMFWASLKQLATSGSITSPVSRVMRSDPVSLNGLVILPSLIRFESAFRSTSFDSSITSFSYCWP